MPSWHMVKNRAQHKMTNVGRISEIMRERISDICSFEQERRDDQPPLRILKKKCE